MILVSLKDGKKIKLDSKATSYSPSNLTKQEEMNTSLDTSDILFDLDSCNSNMSSMDGDHDSDLDKLTHLDSSTSTESVMCKKKRQRLTHLTPEEKLMRRKLKNRVAAQSARDRKKVRMDQLEETVKALREQNEKLKNEN